MEQSTRYFTFEVMAFYCTYSIVYVAIKQYKIYKIYATEYLLKPLRNLIEAHSWIACLRMKYMWHKPTETLSTNTFFEINYFFVETIEEIRVSKRCFNS